MDNEEETNGYKIKEGKKEAFKSPKIMFEAHKNVPEEVKAIIEENLPEREPEAEIPIPHGKVVHSETKWIEEQADGKQQEKEWKQRETLPEDNKPLIDLDKKIVRNVRIGDARKESAPPEKLNHPLQAYSMRMGDIEPLEDMMWTILERIQFIPTYHATDVRQICFELGKVYKEFENKLRDYIDAKGEEFEANKLGDKPE